MTSYPSTECPCAGRATENQKPPLLVASTFSLFLSLVSGCKNILPVQETSQDLTSSYLLLGGYLLDTIEIICFSLVRRGEFLHQLYMLKARRWTGYRTIGTYLYEDLFFFFGAGRQTYFCSYSLVQDF